MYLSRVTLLCLLALTAHAVTPEEAAIRNAYAKFVYAVDLHTVFQAAANPQLTPSELAKLVAAQGIQFTLSNFVIGDLKDIANVPYTTAFPGYPDGRDVINVTLVTESMKEDDGPNIDTEVAKAEWGPGPNGNPLPWSVREMLPIMERESGVNNLTRYATYTVKATFAGRTLTYPAYFLFSKDGQPTPGDTVVGLGGGALAYFLDHSLYPSGLLRTRLRKQVAVEDYLNRIQRDDASCIPGDACCDPKTLQCGVSTADLRRLP
jgi:hypothetical protein